MRENDVILLNVKDRVGDVRSEKNDKTLENGGLKCLLLFLFVNYLFLSIIKSLFIFMYVVKWPSKGL